MVRKEGYGEGAQHVKGAPCDRLLVRLGPGERAEILVLTTPTSATRRRLQRFARLLIENPSAVPLEAPR